MERQEKILALLQKEIDLYDEQEGMVTRYMAPDHGYHTRLTGTVHHVKATSGFALSVLLAKQEPHYDKAIRALHRICDIQDQRKTSPTFGLWSYYLEQDVDHMIAPDYNWANFVGRDLIAVCLLCRDRIPRDLEARLYTAIGNAAECTLRRNVAADYTNIALISSLTLISAGELLKDGRLFETGKARLRTFCAYTKATTGFSEYNSAPYTVVALEETTRMLLFFRDAECRAMAQELNWYGWNMLASHYNTVLAQLTPPQARAYADVDTGRLASVICLGTNGRYGTLREETLDLDTLQYLHFSCPEDLLPLFEEKERFLAHTYYHRNSIRKPGEDVTIIRELDSPDLTAYSYQTPDYSIGAFALCDTWAQRRNVMVIWDREKPKTFRLRGLHNDYDFCSGMTWNQQESNRILGHIGLVTDRGSQHYILDQEKDGTYDVKNLYFAFELGGESGDLTIREDGKDFCIDDGPMHIRLCIEAWVFNGKAAPVKLSADGKRVILTGYDGSMIRMDTTVLDDTYGVFSLQVSYGEAPAETGPVHMEFLPGGRVLSQWQGLQVTSPRGPVPYRRAIGLDGLDASQLLQRTQTILDRLQNLQADGTVEETCPISIISMDSWEWPQGVALFAMFQYYKDSGDRAVLDYIGNWFDRQLRKGLPPQNINTTCPMLTLACLYEETRDEAYLPVLTQWAGAVMHTLPRTPEGGLQHIVSGNANEGQLWDDTLYMTVLFLAKMGQILREDRYIQESVRQFLIHIKYLTDRKTGLLYHGWTFEGNHHFAGALWGRGNSWYTAGLADYLECLDGVPALEGVREFLLSTLRRQAEALARCQDKSGLWHTLLDDPASYLETSASSAFAYGILKAVRKGFLPARFALVGERAVKGVMEQISEDGTVNGVSYGTPVFETLQEYREIPICPMPYGQSMALMMLVEANKAT